MPADAEVRLLRGAIHADADVRGRDTNVRDVDYTDRATIIDPSRPVRIRIDRPCFVRVEVYLASTPLLFSNPIVFYEPRAAKMSRRRAPRRRVT